MKNLNVTTIDRFDCICVIALLCSTTSLLAQEEPTRPNIVFAFADDWGMYASAYAKLNPGGINDAVNTPNFDRIASEGVLFTNAFVNAPSCTPCRSSLLSGQHFWRTGQGAILQGAIWDDKIPSYPLLLQKNGYHIGFSHKVWGPGTPANAPYGASKNSYAKHGNKASQFSQFVSKADDQDSAKASIYNEVRMNFGSFIADRKDAEPFCYWFGPTNPHRTWIAGSGKKLWGIDPATLKGKVPPFLPDVPVVREDIADYLGEVQAFDTYLGVLLEELEKIGELDNTIIVVSGDHGIPGFPNGKCNLYDFGTHVSLAIRWGKHIPTGRVIEDFVSLPDLAPTFLEAAGVQIPDVMTGRSLIPVLQIDQSGVVDKTRDHVVIGRERHVAAVREGNLPYPQRAIRTGDYLYIRNFKPERWPMGDGPGYGRPASSWPTREELTENTFGAFGDMDASPTKAWVILNKDEPGNQKYFNIAFGRRPAEELYDVKNDPHQMQNLAENPELKETKQQLSARLISILTETGDPRVIGDGSTYDSPPFTNESGKKR